MQDIDIGNNDTWTGPDPDCSTCGGEGTLPLTSGRIPCPDCRPLECPVCVGPGGEWRRGYNPQDGGPFRGCCVALTLSVPIWLLLAALAVWMWGGR